MQTSPETGAGSLPRGSLAALITPFREDLGIDRQAVNRLIEWHIASGTQGLVIAGTTGECSTLDFREHVNLIAHAADVSRGRIHIMAGVGANSTTEAVDLAKAACQAGAHSLLSVVPYYNKPTQEGMFRHFAAQADATCLPLVVYSVAGRTVVDLSIETLQRLGEQPNIRGIKDASGDLVRAQQLAAALPSSFVRYSGDDLTAAPYLAMGGHGIISVTANVAPAAVQAQCEGIRAGGLSSLHDGVGALFALSSALFKEASPIPVKYLASRLGLCAPIWRLPLVPPSEDTIRALLEIAEHLKALLGPALSATGVPTAGTGAG